MRGDFLISTTNNIEGGIIKKYVDVVCTNIVIGTNIFSDFAASFTDFFGGRSGSYKNKLNTIYNEAKKEIKAKSIKLGANAIIGLNVDFDEISGKEKSMFMISISGTACIIEYEDSYNTNNSESGFISQSELDKELYRRNIIEKIKGGIDISSISTDWREFLLENPEKEIVESLLDIYYIPSFKSYEAHKNFIDFIERMISLLPKDSTIDAVYKRLDSYPIEMRNLISNCMLFDFTKVLLLCEKDIHLAISLLSTSPSYYKKEDIEIMSKICERIDSLPDVGRIEVVKSGLLGKEQMKFICHNGHKSDKDAQFCENVNCGVNIKGLTEKEVFLVDTFKQKINVLKEMRFG